MACTRITHSATSEAPHVRVFSGVGNAVLFSFYAYTGGFSGGVFVAVGDVNGDGRIDIITGAGSGGAPQVERFEFTTGNAVQTMSFNAYSDGFSGGVSVGVGDTNADGRPDIITGAGPGGAPHVRSFDGITDAVFESFSAFEDEFTRGVFVGGR